MGDIPEEAARGLSTADDWRRAITPALPRGTRWIAPLQALWQAGGQELRFEIGPDLRSALIEATRAWEGDVLATFRRLRDAETWVIVSLQTGELFDFDHPEIN